MKRALLLIFFVVFYVLGFVFHLFTWNVPEQPLTLQLVYSVVILACYGSLWLFLSQQFRKHRVTPAKAFWGTLVLGLLLIGVAYLIGRPGFNVVTLTDPVTGTETDIVTPLALASVVKMNVLSLLETVFFFILLLRFRDLVLFKRTRSSQRNWYVMLALMVIAAFTTFLKPPVEPGFTMIQTMALIPAVVFMVINSFRLSWIVHLSFKEKMPVIGLSMLLLGMFGLAIGLAGDTLMPVFSISLAYYSYPLSIFLLLAGLFGFLYCTTALLSLLFHLPTTSDFQRKTDEMAVMHTLTNLVNQVFDPEKLVSTITASPVEAGSADKAWLAVADPETGSLRPHVIATHNIAPALIAELVDTTAFYQDMLATQEPMLLDQAPADHRVEARPGDGLSSLLVMPLVARDETLGALFVARDVTHGFEKDDVEAISVFAAQAAIALDNARLFEEQIERERLSRELAIAKEVQHKLLPHRLPSLEGVSLAASSVSAHEVGGDYYDFVQLDDHRLAFIVGDVSGKGTSAAFYMAEMQGVFQSVSFLAPDPLDFLTHANRALASSLERNVFISVIYGVLDLQKEELLLARAGHCPAATISLTGEARYLRSQGLGLGLDRGSLFQ
ncbi:MAG: PP2C family protein-serine/threonine phosphatase, partial [Rhodothermales bacterium]